MSVKLTASLAAKTKPDLICQFIAPKRKLSLGPIARPDTSSKLPVQLRAHKDSLLLLVNPLAYQHYTLDEAFRIAGGEGVKHAYKSGLKQVVYFLDGKLKDAEFDQIATGMLLAAYRYNNYKSNAKEPEPKVTLVVGDNLARFKPRFARLQKINQGVSTARDLANAPACDMSPTDLAAYAKAMAKREGLGYKQLSAAQLKEQGYVGITAVGQGSANPPVMFALIHKPSKPKRGAKPLCLVGKGVTFDSGGICIKPAADMWQMKADMHGSATVVGAMQAIAQLKLPVPVIGVVGAAENMPDGKAYRPSDVLRFKNGRTVEVHNTDAEGRMVLADALLYAQGVLKQKRIVDFATLTGACARALGTQYIGRMSKFPALAEQVRKAGEASGELTCDLPLHPEYRLMIESIIADINHMGGPLAGGQTAALFLHEFINKGTEYVHLDIAGTFMALKRDKYWEQRGATGTGVRLAVELATASVG